MLDALLLVALVAGLVPAALFTYSYARHSAWKSSAAGRAIMRLMVITTVTYVSSTATLAWPDFFRSEPGVLIRLVIRVAVAAVLWDLYLLLRRAQREPDTADERREEAR